mgnify:CR=1 FL=1|tara:strand:+ start:1708 stop:2181 length:474 start_codon:yes stop_codon:yes gene_type:complete
MKKFKILLNSISTIAVIGSLIFVGIQINQSNQVAKATIRQSLNETDMQIYAITMDQPSLSKADYKLKKGKKLNDYEKYQLIKYREYNFRDYDNSFYQYQIGLFEEEAWEAYRRLIKKTFNNDLLYFKMWNENKESFSSSFQKEITELLKEIDLENKK